MEEDALGLAVISVVVGAALAAVYHFLSMRLQQWASHRRFMMVPLVTVLGFIVRLAVFTGILVALGLWSHLNILAVCLSFIVLFTILNGIWLYSLAKRHGVPPSAGTSGTT
ncbi:MAG TPA: hypothetical protein VJP78_03130 [Thermoleophilia bacterium]|nr:hypothetical protein [Thermoleophilia bacterium]